MFLSLIEYNTRRISPNCHAHNDQSGIHCEVCGAVFTAPKDLIAPELYSNKASANYRTSEHFFSYLSRPKMYNNLHDGQTIVQVIK